MKVFISFHPDNVLEARRIAEACREKGIDAEFHDMKLSTHGRPNIQEEVIQKIRVYDAVIVLWSQGYALDSWLQIELFAILAAQLNGKERFITLALMDDTPIQATLGSASAVNLRDRLDLAIPEIIDQLPAFSHVFVVMMFNDPDLDSTYRTIIKPTARDFGLNMMRIDEVENSGSITHQILQHIERSGIVLCDLTGTRPNVYFETGYALALGKELILTAKTGSDIHFDLKDRSILFWNTPEDLKNKLASRFDTIIRRRQA